MHYHHRCTTKHTHSRRTHTQQSRAFVHARVVCRMYPNHVRLGNCFVVVVVVRCTRRGNKATMNTVHATYFRYERCAHCLFMHRNYQLHSFPLFHRSHRGSTSLSSVVNRHSSALHNLHGTTLPSAPRTDDRDDFITNLPRQNFSPF